MVLTWSPETDETVVGVNINETIHQNITPPQGLAKVVRNFSPSMGRTNGVAFTETAPLVFPVLDQLDDSHTGEAKTTKEKIRNVKSFTGEYFDRRAQAKFVCFLLPLICYVLTFPGCRVTRKSTSRWTQTNFHLSLLRSKQPDQQRRSSSSRFGWKAQHDRRQRPRNGILGSCWWCSSWPRWVRWRI